MRAHVEAGVRMAGGGKRRQVGHRPAAHQQSHRGRRQPGDLREPADHLPFEVNRRVVAAGDARIHRGGERLGEDANHRGR